MHHILCESPFISRDFYAIRPLILWHILGAFFLRIWGVGVVRIIFNLGHFDTTQKTSRYHKDGPVVENHSAGSDPRSPLAPAYILSWQAGGAL